MTSSTSARAKTLGFRSLVVLGGSALAVTALALPSHAAPVSGFHTSQARLLDTRSNAVVMGPTQGVVRVPVTDDVLSGDSVELTITTTGSTGGGFITAYPDGVAKPTTSNLNFAAGKTLAATALVPVPADGFVDVYIGGATTQVIVDQQGYFDAGAFTGATPSRIADSRQANDGFTKLGAQSGTVTLQLPTGDYVAGKPVALNLTALPAGTSSGYLTAYTPAATAPATSTVNYGGGAAASNLVVVTPSETGTVSLKIAGQAANVLVDLAGAAPAGSTLTGTSSRIADSRSATGLPAGPLKGTYTVTIPAADAPAGTTGVVLNVTATDATGAGFISAYPGTTPPATSELQFTSGQTVAQTIVAPVTVTGTGTAAKSTVTLHVAGSTTQVFVDTEGYVYTPSA